MLMQTTRRLARSALLPALFVLAAATGRGDDSAPAPLNEKWDANAQSLSFDFRGDARRYPDALNGDAARSWPTSIEIDAQQVWPVVTLHARWSIPTADWPSPYRASPLDLALLWMLDAGAYPQSYPEIILESTFNCPRELACEAYAPADFALGHALRGRRLGYEVLARAGFGAADYRVRANVRVGLSADGKTAFYHDAALSITEHLLTRDYVVAVRSVDDRLLFEVQVVCVCAPRMLFRGEAMRRVQSDGEYFIRRTAERFGSQMTANALADLLENLRKRCPPPRTAGPGAAASDAVAPEPSSPR